MHRYRIMLGTATALAASCVAVAVPGAALAAEPTPTVTFSGTGASPVLCATSASVSSLTFDEGLDMIVVNDGVASAKVRVDGVAGALLKSGEAVAITLSAGQHTVGLRPECLLVSGTGTVVVTVVAASVTSEPPAETTGPAPTTAGSGGSGGSGQSSGTGETAEAGSSAGSNATSTGASTATGTSGGNPGRTDAAGTGSGTTGSRGHSSAAGASGTPGGTGAYGTEQTDAATGSLLAGGEVTSTYGAPYRYKNDLHGRNLLAIIALICILGVSVGIIRAILAERPSGRVKA